MSCHMFPSWMATRTEPVAGVSVIWSMPRCSLRL